MGLVVALSPAGLFDRAGRQRGLFRPSPSRRIMPGRSRVTTSDSRTDRCGIQAYRRMEVRAASTDDCRPRDTVGPSTVRVVAHNGADKNFQELAGIFRASLEICGVSGENRLQRRKSEKRLGGGGTIQTQQESLQRFRELWPVGRGLAFFLRMTSPLWFAHFQ